MNTLRVRDEQPEDRPAVRRINEAAFDSPAEANLVDALREQARPLVSLVAEEAGEVVGHILFSPLTLSGRPDLKIMGLAPMAVTPDFQRGGVGSALVRTGLKACEKLGCGAVAVLGHPEYYPRFGFVPAADFGIGCEYDVPREVFMALEIEPGYLRDLSGIVRYHSAFSDL